MALSAPEISRACAVCFGDPDSAQTKSAIAGILVLLAVIVSVLGGIGALAIKWARRAKELEALKGL